MPAPRPSNLEEFMPAFDFRERHHTTVFAPPERVYRAVRALDLSGSRPIRALFRLREAPMLLHRHGRRDHRLGVTLDELLAGGFVLLGERPPWELALGLVGRFWTPTGALRGVDAEGFRRFSAPGYSKALWTFELRELPGGRTRLSTETRVLCTDRESRDRFRLYWLVVGPLSGLIRREILRTIKRQAELPTSVS
jgi:hypothetical protein